MIFTDRDRFARVLHGLETVYGKPNIGERFVLYFQALQKLPIDALERAGVTWVEHATRFPTPADFAAEARAAQRTLRRDGFGPKQLELPRANPVHMREALALIGRIQASKVPLPERLVAFRQMAADFPGHGWGNAAAEIEAELDGRTPNTSWRSTAAALGTAQPALT